MGFGPLSRNSPGENASGVKVAVFVNSHMSMDWAQVFVVAYGLALFVACAEPVSFFALLFGLPIWLVATGFVISTRARRNTPTAPVAEAVTAAV